MAPLDFSGISTIAPVFLGAVAGFFAAWASMRNARNAEEIRGDAKQNSLIIGANSITEVALDTIKEMREQLLDLQTKNKSLEAEITRLRVEISKLHAELERHGIGIIISPLRKHAPPSLNTKPKRSRGKS